MPRGRSSLCATIDGRAAGMPSVRCETPSQQALPVSTLTERGRVPQTCGGTPLRVWRLVYNHRMALRRPEDSEHCVGRLQVLPDGRVLAFNYLDDTITEMDAPRPYTLGRKRPSLGPITIHFDE